MRDLKEDVAGEIRDGAFPRMEEPLPFLSPSRSVPPFHPLSLEVASEFDPTARSDEKALQEVGSSGSGPRRRPGPTQPPPMQRP